MGGPSCFVKTAAPVGAAVLRLESAFLCQRLSGGDCLLLSHGGAVPPHQRKRWRGPRFLEILGRSESALRLSKSIMQTTAHFKYQRAGGPTRPPAFSYLKVLCPAGHHSDAIPTGTSFQASTRPPAGNCMERNQPLTPPCTQPSGTTRAPPVAGHHLPRSHSKPLSAQQKKRPGQSKVRKNRLHSRGI